MKFEFKYNTFHRKMISKHYLKNVNHFVPAQCVQANLKQQPIDLVSYSFLPVVVGGPVVVVAETGIKNKYQYQESIACAPLFSHL